MFNNFPDDDALLGIEQPVPESTINVPEDPENDGPTCDIETIFHSDFSCQGLRSQRRTGTFW